jgi:hypothetical protein
MLLSSEFLRIAPESQLIRSDVHSMLAAVERKLVGLLNVELRFAHRLKWLRGIGLYRPSCHIILHAPSKLKRGRRGWTLEWSA